MHSAHPDLQWGRTYLLTFSSQVPVLSTTSKIGTCLRRLITRILEVVLEVLEVAIEVLEVVLEQSFWSAKFLGIHSGL